MNYGTSIARKKNPCNLKLVLSHNESYKTIVGNGILVYLTIKSDDFDFIDNKIEEDLAGEILEINSKYMPGGGFVKWINVKATKTGKFKIGPYNLKVGNCELTSNSIEIIVHDKPEAAKPEFSYNLPKIGINNHGQKEFIITSNFEFEFNKEIKNEGFDIIPGSSSINQNLENSKFITICKYYFKVVAKKIGNYKITKEYFKYLPRSLEFKELEIIIN